MNPLLSWTLNFISFAYSRENGDDGVFIKMYENKNKNDIVYIIIGSSCIILHFD